MMGPTSQSSRSVGPATPAATLHRSAPAGRAPRWRQPVRASALSARAPLVPLATFRVRPVTVANATVLLESATTAYAFVLTLYFHQVMKLSPLATGLCFLPFTITAAVAARHGQRDRHHDGLGHREGGRRRRRNDPGHLWAGLDRDPAGRQ
jgi:hypothetical protein